MRTNLFTLLSTAVRVAALLHIVQTLFQVGGVFLIPEATATMSKAMGWGWVVGTLISLALGVVLWLWPGLLVRPAVGRSAHDMFESPLSAAQVERIGLCLLGAWFLIEGLAGLASLLTNIIMFGASNMGLAVGLHSLAPQLVYKIGTALLGTVLVLRSHGLVELLQRSRDRETGVSDSARRIAAEIGAAAETVAAAAAPVDAAATATDRDRRGTTG